MPKASPVQSSFTSGEFSPYASARVDLEKRRTALELCDNMIPLKQGALTRRGGTQYIKEVKNSANRTVLVEFEYSTTDVYVLEFGDQYIRFYKGGQTIIETSSGSIDNISNTNPAKLTYNGTDRFSNGDEVQVVAITGMPQVNNGYYIVDSVDTSANTFLLKDVDGNFVDTTNYDPYISGGALRLTYSVASPYTAADLFDSNGVARLKYIQSADVLYLFHPEYKTRALTRQADNSWNLVSVVYEDGAYLNTNTTATTITLSGTSGTVSVTASTGIFSSGDVDRLIRFKDPAGEWTWLTIITYGSPTQVTARIDGQNASAGTATTDWRLGVWSDTTGFPATGTFFQDRLYLGGGPIAYPDRVDATKTGGYSDTFLLFAPTEVDGSVSDDNAIAVTLPSRQVNAIQWMHSDATGLIIGTTGLEWVLRASQSAVLTPANAKPDPISSTRSSSIRPVLASSGTVFVQKSRSKIFDMIFSYDIDRLKPRDVSVTADHLVGLGVVDIAYQQEPLNVIWVATESGLLIGVTYYPDEGVFGYHRHTLGGVSDSDGSPAKVEQVLTISSDDGKRDDLWVVVKRYINGSTRRYIERLAPNYIDGDLIEDSRFLDCGATYSGSATNSIAGLGYLEGETVKILADGRTHPDLVVTDGSITLLNGVTASKVQVGLANSWKVKTLRVEAGAADGTAQGKTKRIHNLSLNIYRSLGLFYGGSSDNVDEYTFEDWTNYDETPELYTGIVGSLPFPDGYNKDGQIYLTGDYPYPFTLLAIMPQLNTQDR